MDVWRYLLDGATACAGLIRLRRSGKGRTMRHPDRAPRRRVARAPTAGGRWAAEGIRVKAVTSSLVGGLCSGGSCCSRSVAYLSSPQGP